ncbi:myelin and lymphocyte protein-like isoform X2 [Phycodurus eques]|uniref:myelin and lymphocyte protein-like isoform X2 n=1 Tax=Phycodurus eques TaxID=693459 RepID=UPI002ACEF73F|nr:myelin and lymphocyte protein-like isoform X2 [Phycodurus eques]
MAATATRSVGGLPSGLAICMTPPDMFYLPELVTGGLVWILVASTHVQPANPLGWVMFVSVFCFVTTLVWALVFVAGCHKNAPDFVYHALAALFYLSAGVNLAFITFVMKSADFRIYQIDIAAVVFAFTATLLYFIHAVLSSMRWKNL